jgi:CheY-like chemotaxis protein
MSRTILIADDDVNVLKLFSLDIEQRNTNVRVKTAERAEEALRILENDTPDVLVLDLRMPDKDGFSVLEHLQETGNNVPVIVLTNYRSDEYVKRCRAMGVKEYIVKHETRMERVVETITSYLEV